MIFPLCHLVISVGAKKKALTLHLFCTMETIDSINLFNIFQHHILSKEL